MSARREAFNVVPETCPAVDRILEGALNAIAREATGPLREALIDALDRAMTAEQELEDCRSELADARSEIDALREEIASIREER